MPWINLSEEDVKLVTDHLRAADERGLHSDRRDQLAIQIEEAAKPGKHDEAFANAAFIRDPDNIESDYCVSVSDEGAYVMAWIWVANDDAGLCENCGASYADGGDGFDGNCPDCADIVDRIENPDDHYSQADWRIAVEQQETINGYEAWRHHNMIEDKERLAARKEGNTDA